MEDKNLPPRLAAIAEWVRAGVPLADVGTDHALLPLSLLRSGQIPSAVATDINAQPLERARSNARKQGEERIRFCLCDGLADVKEGEVGCVVIAGLGGENIADILKRAPWVRNGVQILLQPMSRSEQLRQYLAGNGFSILRERLVEDSGRIYPIIDTVGGEAAAWTEGEYYIGHFDSLKNEELFPRYLAAQLRRWESAAEGLEKSSRESDRARLAEIRAALEDMERMRCSL